MSPAAAAFASACNAPGLPAAVVVGGTDGAVVACVVAGVVAAVWLVPPHPASATARTTTTEARTIRLMLAVSRQAPETRLNALPTRLSRAQRALTTSAWRDCASILGDGRATLA